MIDFVPLQVMSSESPRVGVMLCPHVKFPSPCGECVVKQVIEKGEGLKWKVSVPLRGMSSETAL